MSVKYFKKIPWHLNTALLTKSVKGNLEADVMCHNKAHEVLWERYCTELCKDFGHLVHY